MKSNGVVPALTHRARLRLRAVALLALLGCNGSDRDANDSFVVTAQYPHDPTAYTQGLVLSNGVLFESTGRYGQSAIRRVELATGHVLASHTLPANRFGEGLALLDNRLYQLTWQSSIAYTYDATTLAPRDSITYPGEGWGLATDGTSLILSDGSDSLRFLEPSTFKAQRVVHVTYHGAPLRRLNELEYVDSEVLANVYESNLIARIDPHSGDVTELLDFSDLYRDRSPNAEVMNGIAMSPTAGELLLTGKLWPTIFRVRLKAAATK